MYKLKILIVTIVASLVFAIPSFAQMSQFRQGQALAYPQYLEGCAATKDQYFWAQAQATAQRFAFWNAWNAWNVWNFWNPWNPWNIWSFWNAWNFWNQPNPVMSWDFQKDLSENNQQLGGTSPNLNPSTLTSPAQPPMSTPTATTADLPVCTTSDCEETLISPAQPPIPTPTATTVDLSACTTSDCEETLISPAQPPMPTPTATTVDLSPCTTSDCDSQFQTQAETQQVVNPAPDDTLALDTTQELVTEEGINLVFPLLRDTVAGMFQQFWYQLSASLTQSLTPTATTVDLSSCSASDCDSPFQTQAETQQVLNTVPDDSLELDTTQELVTEADVNLVFPLLRDAVAGMFQQFWHQVSASLTQSLTPTATTADLPSCTTSDCED